MNIHTLRPSQARVAPESNDIGMVFDKVLHMRFSATNSLLYDFVFAWDNWDKNGRTPSRKGF